MPRDLYVEIPGHGPARINAAFGIARRRGEEPMSLLRRVVEDTLDVMMNLRKVVFALHVNRPKILRLRAQGRVGDVTKTLDVILRPDKIDPARPVPIPGKIVHWREE